MIHIRVYKPPLLERLWSGLPVFMPILYAAEGSAAWTRLWDRR